MCLTDLDRGELAVKLGVKQCGREDPGRRVRLANHLVQAATHVIDERVVLLDFCDVNIYVFVVPVAG